MTNLLKSKINNLIGTISRILIKTKIFRFIFFKIFDEVNKNLIHSEDSNLKFYVNNYLNKFRVETLLTKEPDTIKWIDGFNENEIFYDVGANIGLYSCYACSKGIKSFCFEPSVFNLDLLAKNLSINKLSNKAVIIPISLFSKNSTSNFNLSNTEQGSALNSFNEKYGYDGNDLKIKMSYKTIGITLDDCIKIFELPQPDHIKIDVDGIEHLILKGAVNTLSSVKSILIEISDDFNEQKENCEKILQSNNFKLYSKQNSEIFRGSKFEKCYNQIWLKK